MTRRPKVEDLRPRTSGDAAAMLREVRAQATREARIRTAAIVLAAISFLATDYLALLVVDWLGGFGMLAWLAGVAVFAQLVLAEVVTLWAAVSNVRGLRKVARGGAE